MTATKDTMTSFPEELFMMLKALEDAGVKANVKIPETPEQEFERLTQTRDAVEY
jgi:hypothetical protein